MRLEIFQFIVPLAFLAIWALTALLNRNAEQLPPRPMAGPPDGIPRWGAAPARVAPSGPSRYMGASDRQPGTANLKADSRWSPQAATDRERTDAERKPRLDEGIVVLESESRGSYAGPGAAATPSRGARVPSNRRGTRGRSSAQTATARSVEPVKARALSGLVNQPLSDQKGRHLEIVPLASPLVPIDLPLAQSVSSSVTSTAARSQPKSTVAGTDFRARLMTADKLREIMLLSEIMQRPVSLRGPGRGRPAH